MNSKTNFLNITAWVLLIGGIILFIPSLGGTIVLVGISIIIFLLNFILKRKTTKSKNQIAGLFWLVAIILIYQTTKQIIINTNGKPQRIFIVAGIENKPKIHSWWKWQNNVYLDNDYVIYTSTKGTQIDMDNIKIFDANGKSIGSRGGVKMINSCEEEKSTIAMQTIYLFSEKEYDSIENKRYSELSEWQSNRCKNGR